MRIISGTLRGKKLLPLSGTAIRPSGNRLRESVFNILSQGIRGRTVLDLFAGTGALGIEALSRGAVSAVFVDKSDMAISLIRQNICSCRLEGRTKVVKWDVENNLNCIKSDMFPGFDLVFTDPPYNQNLTEVTLRHLHTSRCLKKGACVVAEHSLREKIPEDDSVYVIADQRRYGKSLVSFLDYML